MCKSCLSRSFKTLRTKPRRGEANLIPLEVLAGLLPAAEKGTNPILRGLGGICKRHSTLRSPAPEYSHVGLEGTLKNNPTLERTLLSLVLEVLEEQDRKNPTGFHSWQAMERCCNTLPRCQRSRILTRTANGFQMSLSRCGCCLST